MTQTRETQAVQIDAALWQALCALAKTEGRATDTLVEEALTHLLDERRTREARPHVMAAYQTSHAPFETLYRKLAQ